MSPPRFPGEGRDPLCATHGIELGGASPLRAARSGTDSQKPAPALEQGATALQRCGVGRKPEANRGADEQEPDTKPAPAKAGGQCGGATRRWTGTPDTPSVARTGKSGGRPEKVQCLTVGDLLGSPGEPEQGVGDGVRWSGRGQPRP